MSPIITQWSDNLGYTYYFEHLQSIEIDNNGPIPCLEIRCKPSHPANKWGDKTITARYLIGTPWRWISQREADMVCRQWAVYVGSRDDPPKFEIPFYTISTEKYPV